MENVYANYEISKKFRPHRPALDFHRGPAANKSKKCPHCGRNLSQPDPLPPVIAKF